MLGYVLAQSFNQNNVSPEASPWTSRLEFAVGQQLCHILGYQTGSRSECHDGEPVGWGHITADGSIANIESMWCVNFLNLFCQ